MNATDFILAALVAIVCGTLAQITSGYSRGGWIVNLGLGFLGALAGVVLAQSFDAPEIYNLSVHGVHFPIIYSIIGSVLFVAVVRLLVKSRRR
jgi:uncharacterized membrane protein YeaQ/YmgE (transglycosylase-associated protein family)